MRKVFNFLTHDLTIALASLVSVIFFAHGTSQAILLTFGVYCLLHWQIDRLEERVSKLEGKNG